MSEVFSGPTKCMPIELWIKCPLTTHVRFQLNSVERACLRNDSARWLQGRRLPLRCWNSEPRHNNHQIRAAITEFLRRMLWSTGLTRRSAKIGFLETIISTVLWRRGLRYPL